MAPDPPLRVSAIVIGDEILGGFVRDTNSGWLAERCQGAGVPLDRVTTVPDDLGAIDEALGTELGRRRPRVVVTSGGIGSTPDDRTMEAVARHLGTALVVQPEIDARITAAVERSAARGIDVAEAHERSMRKMARVPDGTYLLGRIDSLVPAVALDVDGGSRAAAGATIVILPGIPSEFRRIMTASIEPLLLAGRGLPQHVVEITHPYPESALNPVLDRLVAEFPDVHVGSYPDRVCTVRLKGPVERTEAAAALVRDAVGTLHRTPGAAALRDSWRSYWKRDEAAG